MYLAKRYTTLRRQKLFDTEECNNVIADNIKYVFERNLLR